MTKESIDNSPELIETVSSISYKLRNAPATLNEEGFMVKEATQLANSKTVYDNFLNVYDEAHKDMLGSLDDWDNNAYIHFTSMTGHKSNTSYYATLSLYPKGLSNELESGIRESYGKPILLLHFFSIPESPPGLIGIRHTLGNDTNDFLFYKTATPDDISYLNDTINIPYFSLRQINE